MELRDDIDDDQLILYIENHLNSDDVDKAWESRFEENESQIKVIDTVEETQPEPSEPQKPSTSHDLRPRKKRAPHQIIKKPIKRPKKKKLPSNKEEILKAIEAIDEVLALLQEKMSKLLETEYDLLMFKYDNMIDIKPSISSETTKKSANLISNFLYQFRSPYFKDQKYFWAPLNADSKTISRINKDLACQSWSQFYVERLEEAVRKLIVKAYVSSVKRKHSDSLSVNFDTKLDTLKTINYFKNQPLKTFLNDGMESNIDWYSVSDYLNSKYSPSECEKMWKLYASPNINKGPWTKKETSMLKDATNWQEVASSLKTGRSGYQCFLYCMNHYKKLDSSPWSEKEMHFLKQVVSKCTYRSKIRWPQVNYFLENRNFRQIYDKYNLSANPDIKLGHFGAKEDRLLLMLQHKFDLNPKQLSKVIKHRTHKQIKCRLEQSLKPEKNIKFGDWTLEEDELLVKLVDEIGQDWASIAKQFERRNRVQVRHRFNRLKGILDTGKQLKDIKRLNRTLKKKSKLYTSKLTKPKYKNKSKELKKVMNSLQNHFNEQKEETIYSVDKELLKFFMPRLDSSIFVEKFVPGDRLNEVEQIFEALNPKLVRNDEVVDNLRIKDADKPELASLFDQSDLMEMMFKKGEEKKKKFRLIPPNKNSLQALTSLLLPIRISEPLKKQSVFTDLLNDGFSRQKVSKILGVEGLSTESISCPLMDSDTALKTILTSCDKFAERMASIFLWTGVVSTDMGEVKENASEETEE